MTDTQDTKSDNTDASKSQPATDAKAAKTTAAAKKSDKSSAKTAKIAATADTKNTKASVQSKNQQTPSNASAVKQVPAAPSKKSGFATLLALIAVLIAAYAAYQSWMLSQQLQVTSQQSQTQQAAQQSQQQQVAAVGVAVNTLQAEVAQKQQDLVAQQERMDAALQNALQQMAQTQNKQQAQLPKWELAEAEYLLRLANQRLAMEQNPASAVTLLQAADEIMQASEQLGSYGVRQAIAKNIAALTSVPVVDLEGVYARLAALMTQSSELTYVAPSVTVSDTVAPSVVVEEAKTAVPETAPEADAITWSQQAWQFSKQVMNGVWQELSVLVRIQERSGADQLLLTPEVEGLIRMRMQLSLSQAQVALLRGQQAVYQASLQQVDGLLGDYYRQTDVVAMAMSKQIAILAQVQVMAEMPDISASLYALQDLQAAIHAQQGAE